MTAVVKLLAATSAVLAAALTNCKGVASEVRPLTVHRSRDAVLIDNGLVALELQRQENRVAIALKAPDPQGKWREICRSFRPDFNLHPQGNRFFDPAVNAHRYQASELATDYQILEEQPDRIVVQISGAAAEADVKQTISLAKGDPYVHVEVAAELQEPLLDYLMSSFIFRCQGPPEFIHSPSAKKTDPRAGPAEDQVIGDHAFHSPAVILQQGSNFAALVPDLDLINRCRVVSPDARRKMGVKRNQFSVPIEDDNYTMPTALDLNMRSGLTPEPVFTYGIMDFVVSHHMRYQRANDGSMIRRLADNRICYGFDLFVGANERANAGYQKIARHLWKKYGHPFFVNHRHLAMPFAEYVNTIYGVVSQPMDPAVQAPVPGYADHGAFLDFQLNGRPVGGMVSPLKPLGFGDALWNFEFWNNVRDAAGMHYWGKKLKKPELVDRAKRIVNLALEAPQNSDGFFSLVYLAERRKWMTSTLGPSPNVASIFAGGKILPDSKQVYSVPAMSKTAAYMLEYYLRCDRDTRIVDYLSRYADGLLGRIDERGCIASYYTPDMQPIEALQFSAQPAASMWFLAELYNVTKKEDYRNGSEAIAGYIIREILPTQSWIDLEPYYSCGQCGTEFLRDDEQSLPIRGNLSTFWASKGFAALYRATKNDEYLHAGEQTVDYVSFSQACWNPHFVYTAIPFGGFTVDNVDTATWMDARQCEMVEPFIWYGCTLGRRDLIERGVAAARASTVLINHPRHKQNYIYRHTNIYGFGLGPENINHEGHNQSAMRTHPSWGECSGIFTGLADADRMLGGGYIDFERRITVGVDGLSISTHSDSEGRLHVFAQGKLASLPVPWNEHYETIFNVNGCSGEQTCELALNDSPPVTLEGAATLSLPCLVRSDGSVELLDSR